MELEELLSSSCRRKILKVLLSNGSTNMMQLVVKVNSKYPQVNSHLQILQKEGLIIDKRTGYMRVISLNKENPRTTLALEILKMFDSEGNDKRIGKPR